MEELKRLRQQHLEQQHKILQAEIEADIALVLKAKESISKEKCKEALKQHFIKYGSFPTHEDKCSAYFKVPASKVDAFEKGKSVAARLKNENVSFFQDEESDYYHVYLPVKDFF